MSRYMLELEVSGCMAWRLATFHVIVPLNLCGLGIMFCHGGALCGNCCVTALWLLCVILVLLLVSGQGSSLW